MKIFVYGTLKKGGMNHYLIENCEFIGKANTIDKFAMHPSICNSYPFVIESNRLNNIEGEVYEVKSKRILKQLEILEGSPTLYYRKKVFITYQNNTKEEVQMYIKNENHYPNMMDTTKILKNWEITIDNRN